MYKKLFKIFQSVLLYDGCVLATEKLAILYLRGFIDNRIFNLDVLSLLNSF